jgi:hypothetical protein
MFFIAKIGVRGLAVARYSDDLDAELGKIRLDPRKILRFERTSRCIVFRIKIQNRVRGFFEIFFECCVHIFLKNDGKIV